MDRNQLAAALDAHRKNLVSLEAIRPSCNTCQSYQAGVCEAVGERPPKEIIPEGCDDWVFDGIPF